MKLLFCLFCYLLILPACRHRAETVSPVRESITESVYASGMIKSQNQYQVFATVNGLLHRVFVEEGDTVKKGAPLFTILSESSTLARQSAQLGADLADFRANQGRLEELLLQIDLARQKMINDSLLMIRQQNLWSQNIGSQVEMEQAGLQFQNSKTNYASAQLRYQDEKRRLSILSQQAQKNLQITRSQESDFTITSIMDGRVYAVYKEQGEMITVQTPLAIIGDARDYILELQVDEYDITRVRVGQPVAVTMDSYKGEVFEAVVTKIYPLMNERSKTIKTEAVFIQPPPTLYPNLTLEANIILQVKENVLTLPRKFILKDRYVITVEGDTLEVSTGLKDYQKAEIVSGLDEHHIIQIPE